MMPRHLLRLSLLSTAFSLAACGEDSPDDGGDTLPDVTDDTSDTAGDTSDTGGDTSDTTGDTSDDTTDTQVDTTDTSSDLLANGEGCFVDGECQSGLCVTTAEATLTCVEPCTDSCPAGTACLQGLPDRAATVGACVPEDLCLDGDGDNYGYGPACLGSDCNDSNVRLNTVSDEVCDLADNDCDGEVDENIATVGTDCSTGAEGQCAPGTIACARGEEVCQPRFVSAAEFCDGLDNDCDGAIDEDEDGQPLSQACYSGAPGTEGVSLCRAGTVTCIDGALGACVGEVVPVEETCDGVDSDCDGVADNGFNPQRYFPDADGDGFADASATALLTCSPPAGYVTAVGDCNDSDPRIYPGAIEEPGDGIDLNCDGAELCYVDADGDGYRAAEPALTAALDCVSGGFVTNLSLPGDCNDGSASVNPGATDSVADGLDSDCDGLEVCFADADLDGYYGAETVLSATVTCDGAGLGNLFSPGGDCNDANASVKPGVADGCDQVDTDCDGLVDDDEAVQLFADLDGDTFGDASATPFFDCRPLPNVSTNNTDCNDSASDVNPSAVEITGNEIDENCDTIEVCFVDRDRDGYRTTNTTLSVENLTCTDGFEAAASVPPGDCLDVGNPAITSLVNPGATEVLGNSLDDDCDGITDENF
jgi:hypothetical protein